MCGRFSISGRVLGAVGGESCALQDGGPSDIKVELLSDSGDVVSSVSTSSGGSYLFKNIIPGNTHRYQLFLICHTSQDVVILISV